MPSPNKILTDRITGLLDQLHSSFRASAPMSSSSKGLERELFISGLLSQVFPLHYRFGSGDITDHLGGSSGQIDIVLEFPISFSFPVFHGGPRLYLAENVAAALEIKSDLRKQWAEVIHKSHALSKITRRFVPQHLEEIAKGVLAGTSDFPISSTPEDTAKTLRNIADIFSKTSQRIPFFVVGFRGWDNAQHIRNQIGSAPIDGVFLVEPRIFVTDTK